MGVHTFPKGICPKVNVIARLEYKLAYYNSAVHRFNHYTMRTPPSIRIKTIEGSNQVETLRKAEAGVILLQDNVPIHTAKVTLAESASCGFELLSHPSYSPDFAVVDFFLVFELKPCH